MNRRRLVPSAPAAVPVTAPAAADGGTVDLFARTLWAEGRNQSVRGIEAVAAVVMNRAAVTPRATVATVCRAFPCWNEDHPDRPLIEALRPGVAGGRTTTDTLLFGTCLRIARRAVAGVLDDPTGGATIYHDASVLPDWAARRAPAAEIGGRLFYAIDIGEAGA